MILCSYRPPPNFGDPMIDRIPPNAWHQMSPRNMGPLSNPGVRGFGNQLPPRSGDLGMPLNPVRTNLMILQHVILNVWYCILMCEMHMSWMAWSCKIFGLVCLHKEFLFLTICLFHRFLTILAILQGGPADGPLPGRAVSSTSSALQQVSEICLHFNAFMVFHGHTITSNKTFYKIFQNFCQPESQVLSLGQQISPLQKPLQSPQHMPPLQLHPQVPSSYSHTQTSLGQVQIPGQTPFSQAQPSQHLLGMSGHLSTSQPQGQQIASSSTALPTPLNIKLQSSSLPSGTSQQQIPAPVQQQLHQPYQQSPSQLAQMLSQQTQTLQATFQSSQQAFSQLQQQLQLMQPSNQSLPLQQGSQGTKQQV